MDDPRERIATKKSQNDCGIDDLCDMLLFSYEQHNHGLGADLRLPFDQESLRNLLKKVYAASLLTEEGRHPQVRLVLGSDQVSELPFSPIVRFQPPSRIGEANDLRKLGPAASDPSCALWIAEGEDGGTRGVECLGIIDVDRLYTTTRIGTQESIVRGEHIVGNTTYVSVRIEGPGALRARVALDRCEFVLRGCQIRQTRSFAYLEEIVNQVCSIEKVLTTEFDLKNDIALALARVLDAANSKRHGAAFLLLPEIGLTHDVIHRAYCIDGGHEVLLDLGKALTEFASCRKHLQEVKPGDNPSEVQSMVNPQEIITRADQWFDKRRDLSVLQNAVAGLSSVDGCVVLDRSLKIHLFGAKIRSPQPDKELKVIDPDTKDDLSSEMKKLGTRNNSACRFCSDHPGAYAFVLSQDSDLRLYYSDTQHVYALLDLDIYNI